MTSALSTPVLVALWMLAICPSGACLACIVHLETPCPVIDTGTG